MAYAKGCDLEISGFGHYTFDGKRIVIEEIFPLMPQTCTGTETEMLRETMTRLAESKYSSRTNFWWHSHVNMQVFWSSVDKDCIQGLGGRETVLKNMLSLVVNKRYEYKMRFDYYKPYGMFVDNIPLEVISPQLSSREIAVINREIKKNVKLKKLEQPKQPEKQTLQSIGNSGLWEFDQKTKEWVRKSKNEDKKEEKKTQDLFGQEEPVNQKAGLKDKSIPLSVEEDLIKNGYQYDDTIDSWIFPTT